MKLTNEFTVNTPIDQAWSVLTDLEGIAPCLPGAQLTGVDGDVYTGKVKVKVGPVVSEFAGTAQFVEKDDANHRAVIDAKGKDSRSAANAAALITAQLKPSGTSTVVTVDTDLKISGKLAQFGSGMIREVSGKLLGQFVTQLEAKIAADAANGTLPAPTGATDEPAPAVEAAPAASAASAASAAEAVPVVEAGQDAAPAVEAAPAASAAEAVPVVDLAVADGADDSKPRLTPEAPAAVPATAAVTAPVSLPEDGPIPDEIAHREVAADAEYHASRAAAPASAASRVPAASGASAASAVSDSSGAPAASAVSDVSGVPAPSGAPEAEVAAAPAAVVTPVAATPAPTPSVPDSSATAAPAADAAVVAAAAPAAASAPAPAAASAAASAPAAAAVSATHRTISSTAEPEALDLMSLAGSSIYKRLIPVVVAVVVVAAIVIWLVVR